MCSYDSATCAGNRPVLSSALAGLLVYERRSRRRRTAKRVGAKGAGQAVQGGVRVAIHGSDLLEVHVER